MNENKQTLQGWTALLGLLAAVIMGVLFYWYHPSDKTAMQPEHFTLFEGGQNTPYTIGKSGVERAPLPLTSAPQKVIFANGASLTVNTMGLVWAPASGSTTITLIERAGLTQDAWSIAADGSMAVLYNSATHNYDVFAIQYEGAAVDYRGSFAQPMLPTYTVAVAMLGNDRVILRTGEPESFEVYKIKDNSVEHSYSATLFTPNVTQ